MRQIALLLVLLVSACGSFDAYRARTGLLEAPETEVFSCMGVPLEAAQMTKHLSIAQWDYAQTSTDVDVSLGVYEVKLGRPGICHAILTFQDGYVKEVHYTGTVVTATDLDSVCGKLVHDCLWKRGHDPLPPDFNSKSVTSQK